MRSDYEAVIARIDERGVGNLTLARPETRNALNGQMIDEAREVVAHYSENPDVRVVVLSAQGEVFCSGMDLAYLQSQFDKPFDERIAEAKKLALLLRELEMLPKLLIGRISGSAFAGGAGLTSVCDIAIGVTEAKFAITETRLGLIPALISPYIVKRIGEVNARRYLLNAKPFTSAEAVNCGLLTSAVSSGDLDQVLDREIDLALRCSLRAVAETKQLIRFVGQNDVDDSFEYTVDRVVDMWGWPESTEGMQSFFEKRLPNWDWRNVSPKE